MIKRILICMGYCCNGIATHFPPIKFLSLKRLKNLRPVNWVPVHCKLNRELRRGKLSSKKTFQLY
jgi:hypothetical protein